MAEAVILDTRLTWRDIATVAEGRALALSPAAWRRIARAREIVEALVDKEIRGYGINTGVGALSDVIIRREDQQALSRNIILSHNCDVGEPLGTAETRAVMAAQIGNFAHGLSGVSLEVVETLLALLNADMLPIIPSKGSVGYLTHAAAIGLVLIGGGECIHAGQRISGRDALTKIGREPLTLKAKEGLSLVNGTPCATGLGALAVFRLGYLLEWADATAAMSYENLGAQADPFAEMPLALRRSEGLQQVGRNLRHWLQGSALLAQSAGR